MSVRTGGGEAEYKNILRGRHKKTLLGAGREAKHGFAEMVCSPCLKLLEKKKKQKKKKKGT